MKKYKKAFKNIKKLILKSNQVVLVPHVDPDPDALCACYALREYLISICDKVYIGLQAPLLSKYDFIFNGQKDFIKTPEEFDNISESIDLVVALDLGVKTRGGVWTNNIENAKIVNIDHHIDNDKFGDINIVDTKYSSTCEMIYEFFTVNKINVTEKMAKAIYTGIVYDTGSFRYNATSLKTHSYVGEIVDNYDFDKNEIYEILFENKKVQSLCLQTKVFNSLQLYRDGEIALTMLEKKDYSSCSAEESDAIELVRIGSSIQGVDFSIFIHEKVDKIKVSLRSKSDFNVNAVARKFDGGGHVKASGFSMQGSVPEVKNKVLDTLINMYEDYKSSGKYSTEN